MGYIGDTHPKTGNHDALQNPEVLSALFLVMVLGPWMK